MTSEDRVTHAERLLVEEAVSWYQQARRDGTLSDFDTTGAFGDLVFGIHEVAKERGETGEDRPAPQREEAAPKSYDHAEPDEPTFAYLVIHAGGQATFAYLDEDAAHERAQHTQSVVVKLPVAGDYRPAETG